MTGAHPTPGPRVPGTDAGAGLPRAFRWGVATSAYQIEGAVSLGGRTASIWDTFCGVPGAVADSSDGSLACDHVARMPDDVRLLAWLGVDTYRFSVSWPRVQPHGRGPASAAGLGLYDRLVDHLLAAGVEPWVTLYHWDLPQELEDAGGWPARDTAARFAEYAALVSGRLGDRVPTWTTINEPWCVAMYGYRDGIHAPGRRDPAAATAAVHHLLLGHGLAVAALRSAAGAAVDLGITLNLGGSRPSTASPADVDAARRADGELVRTYLDALVHGRYPPDVLDDLASSGLELPVRDGDLATIAAPIDVLGVNYYFDAVVSAGGPVPPAARRTGTGWPVTPEGLESLLLRLSRDWPGLPVVVTENGASYEAGVDDPERTAFLAEHVAAVARAYRRGADVRGYFVWTLLDNFEWSHGYGPKFGLVSVDRRTLRRTPRRSAEWYRATMTSSRTGAREECDG